MKDRRLFVQSSKTRVTVKNASLGAAVLGGAIVLGLGLSYASTYNRTTTTTVPSPKKDLNTTSRTVIETDVKKSESSIFSAEKKTSVYSFGYNQYGQLMLGDVTDVFAPKRVNFNHETVCAVRAASKTSALLTTKGHVFTAGSGLDGRLGTGITIPPLSAPDQTNPMQVQKLKDIVDVELGEFGGAAIDSVGKLFTWGRSWGGENGHSDANPGLPDLVPHPNRIIQVSRGRQHLAFVDENGAVFSCGVGREGALGLGSFSNVSVASRVRGELENKVVRKVACGRDTTFALTEDGQLFSWGNDDYGMLGLGKAERRVSEPRLISSLSDTKIAQLSCGEGFAAAVSENGDLFMCGRGSDGQLATGSRDDSSFFTRVLNLPGPVEKVSCGGGHVAALLKDGSLYVWG